MSSFLFQPSRVCYYRPIGLLKEKAGKARRSVTVIDSYPSRPVMDDILAAVGKTVRVAVLCGQGEDFDIRRMQAWRILLENPPKSREVVFKTLPAFGARLYIFDDDVVLVSGDPYDEMSLGIVLEGVDAQPVIEFWEDRWRQAEPLTRSRKAHLIDRLKSVRIEEMDAAGRRALISLINERGMFIRIHVRLFQGFRHPFMLNPGRKADSEPFCWHIIQSRHFKALKSAAARLYALRRRPYCIETPMGIFIRSSDRERWKTDFDGQVAAFRETVSDYVRKNYRSIRKEAFEYLDAYLERFKGLGRYAEPVFSMTTGHDMEEYIRKRCGRYFPSKKKLIGSCRAWFVPFGLHPSITVDKAVLQLLYRSAMQLRLL